MNFIKNKWYLIVGFSLVIIHNLIKGSINIKWLIFYIIGSLFFLGLDLKSKQAE